MLPVDNRLAELIRLERASTRDVLRAQKGWQRLQTALEKGSWIEPGLPSDRGLRFSRLRRVARGAIVLAIGGVVLTGTGLLWHHSSTAPATPMPTLVSSKPLDALLQVDSSNPIRLSPPAVAGSSIAAPRLRTAGRGNGTTSGIDTTVGTFEKELALIKAAKMELDRGHTAAALSLVQRHAASYPRGIFAGEREALRILASCESWAEPQRAKACSEFTRAYPGSPYVNRIRHSCGPVEDENSN